MAVTHTPGPWFHREEALHDRKYHIAGRGPRIESANGELLAQVFRSSRKPGRDLVAEADGNLIAAAPELLAACEAAIKYDDAIRGRAKNGEYELNVDAAIAKGIDLDRLYFDWMTKAKIAIAKVRGKQTVASKAT